LALAMAIPFPAEDATRQVFGEAMRSAVICQALTRD
jgi:hypothetical protein